jgi:hypothetical protein
LAAGIGVACLGAAATESEAAERAAPETVVVGLTGVDAAAVDAFITALGARDLRRDAPVATGATLAVGASDARLDEGAAAAATGTLGRFLASTAAMVSAAAIDLRREEMVGRATESCGAMDMRRLATRLADGA